MPALNPVSRRSVLLVGAASLVALPGCSSTLPPPGITPVSPFDIARYEGRWYELARMDHRFERGLSDVSATYQRQADGSVRVVNRGFDAGKGEWRESVGKALFTGDPNTASLKVSFFGPFYGGYHVAALDADYRWAVVVGPDLGYAWILSRSKAVAPTERQALQARAAALGIDAQALIWVTQQRTDPQA